MKIDRSNQRMRAQAAALKARVTHEAVQRVGVTTTVPQPQFTPVVAAAPEQNGIGNQVPQKKQPLRWRNVDNGVERSDGRNDNTYTDWRWGS